MSNITDDYPSTSSNITSISQCTIEICPLSLAVMRYIPSVPVNAVFTSLFATFLIVQIIMLFRFKTWSFTTAISLALIVQILAYASRIQTHFNMFDIDPYITESTSLTISPFILTLAIYLPLLHLSHIFSPTSNPTTKSATSNTPLKTVPKLTTPTTTHDLTPLPLFLIFLTLDLLALLLQTIGQGLTHANAKPGVGITLAGLVLQVFNLVAFMIVAVDCGWSIREKRREERLRCWVEGGGGGEKGVTGKGNEVRWFLGALFTSTFLLLIRATFRLIALLHGVDSPVMNNEALFMVLEGGSVLTVVGLLTFFHPGRVLGAEWKGSGFWMGFGGEKGGEVGKGDGIDVLPFERPGRVREWPL